MTDLISIGQASLNTRPHALYRFYDASDVLLYVGITVDPAARFKKHRGDKPWWDDVDHIGIEKFTTRKEAEAAEKKAIQTEQPLHNVVHNTFVAAPEEDRSDGDLACDIVYGIIGIDHGSDKHRDLLTQARDSAEENEREFGDPDAEVARLLVSDLVEKEWSDSYQIASLLRAVPKIDLERHRALAKAEWVEHGVANPSADDIEREVIRRLAGELAWFYLGRIDHEQRQNCLRLAQTHNIDASSIPVRALEYYQHHLDGDLQQVLEREGRA